MSHCGDHTCLACLLEVADEEDAESASDARGHAVPECDRCRGTDAPDNEFQVVCPRCYEKLCRRRKETDQLLVRELGLSLEASSAEIKEKIEALWGVVAQARYLVRWWDHPDLKREARHSLVESCEEGLRAKLLALDGPEEAWEPP